MRAVNESIVVTLLPSNLLPSNWNRLLSVLKILPSCLLANCNKNFDDFIHVAFSWYFYFSAYGYGHGKSRRPDDTPRFTPTHKYNSWAGNKKRGAESVRSKKSPGKNN